MEMNNEMIMAKDVCGFWKGIKELMEVSYSVGDAIEHDGVLGSVFKEAEKVESQLKNLKDDPVKVNNFLDYHMEKFIVAKLASNVINKSHQVGPEIEIQDDRMIYKTSGGLIFGWLNLDEYYSVYKEQKFRFFVDHPSGWHEESTLKKALEGVGYQLVKSKYNFHSCLDIEDVLKSPLG